MFRSRLSPKLTVTRGVENCLQVFPEERWKRLTEVINAQPLGSGSARVIRRKLLASASECEMDRQGRIMIPEHLRRFAQLDGEAVVIGVGDYLEIWDPRIWMQIDEETEEEFVAIAEQLADEGI